MGLRLLTVAGRGLTGRSWKLAASTPACTPVPLQQLTLAPRSQHAACQPAAFTRCSLCCRPAGSAVMQDVQLPCSLLSTTNHEATPPALPLLLYADHFQAHLPPVWPAEVALPPAAQAKAGE